MEKSSQIPPEDDGRTGHRKLGNKFYNIGSTVRPPHFGHEEMDRVRVGSISPCSSWGHHDSARRSHSTNPSSTVADEENPSQKQFSLKKICKSIMFLRNSN